MYDSLIIHGNLSTLAGVGLKKIYYNRKFYEKNCKMLIKNIRITKMPSFTTAIYATLKITRNADEF